VIGLDASDAILVSAKQGIGIHETLEAIVQRVPPPAAPDAPLRALIFDSWFDPYRGVIILARMVDGAIAHGAEDQALVERPAVRCRGLGYQSPKPIPCRNCGRRSRLHLRQHQERGDAKIGDTITDARIRPPSRCPASRDQADGLRGPVIRWNRTSTACCAMRSKSCA
jgi:GTP-binding protein LepA